MTIAERQVETEIRALEPIEEAAQYLDLEPWILMRLRQPERETHLNRQIHRDNGEAAIVRAYRVQHSSARGLCMGPLVVSKEVTLGDLRAEAMKRTLQYALWGLPFSGGASLISVDMDEWSETELRMMMTGFAERCVGGSEGDVVTPSRDLPRQIMAWIAGAGGSEREQLARVTGKPMSLGGLDREQIAARFCVGIIRSALGGSLSGRQISFVGFDALAQRTASELQSVGASVVGVADRTGAIYQSTGLNVELLLRHVAEQSVVYGYPEGKSVSFKEMIHTPVDVLVLADKEELTVRPEAQLVVEAGGALASEMGDNSKVVPAILGDFGLALADFLEWRKAECGFCADREVMRGMQGQIRRTWQAVSNYAAEHDLSLRKAVEVLALSKVAEAIRMKR